MLECNAHKAGALGQVDSLMAMLHVEALAHAAWADQHAARPGQQGMHDAGARGTAPEPPPQVSHHRAIEALRAAHIVSLQLQNATTHTHIILLSLAQLAISAGQHGACRAAPQSPSQVPDDWTVEALHRAQSRSHFLQIASLGRRDSHAQSLSGACMSTGIFTVH